jgi:hypothetical protein
MAPALLDADWRRELIASLAEEDPFCPEPPTEAAEAWTEARLPRRQRTPRLTPPVRAGAAQVPAARRERVCALVPGAGAVRGAARRHQHVA